VLQLAGDGFAARTLIELVIYSSPQLVGTAQTTGTGDFTAQVTMPAGLGGAHTLVAGGLGPDRRYRYLTVGVTFPAGVSGGSDSGGSTSSNGLAVTGGPALPTGVLGGLLFTLGLGLTGLGRRRARHLSRRVRWSRARPRLP